MPVENLSTLLKGVGVGIHFGHKNILDEVNFELKEGEIVGVVGRNGSGKSTFLKVIAGLAEPDVGKLEYKTGISLGYVAQEFDFDSSDTIFEAVAKGWFETKLLFDSDELVYVSDLVELEKPWKHLDLVKHEYVASEINDIIRSLVGIDSTKPVKNLSGGERRKVALVKAVIGRPDILILDEPTNHLDIQAIQNLEDIIKTYTGAVLLVSHDRYFLDNLANRMIEIYDGKMYQHAGNYHDYLQAKALRLEISGTQEERKEAFLKRELEWVNAGVKGRGTKDKGRLQRFYELKDQKKGLIYEDMEPILPPIKPLGNKIINFEDLDLEIGNKKVLTNFNFSFDQNTRLGIIGPNGSGKTTIIKSILGKIPVQKGKIVIGQNTEFNYQDQEKMTLNLDNTPFEEVGESQETTSFGERTISTRAYLRRFLFDNQRITSPIKGFSGGEKARLLLAKILKKSGNCLILDEPTNDLDLETIRLLEESLERYEGIAILISHDRYFLDRTCNTILALEGDGKFTLSTGNYSDYVAKKKTFKPVNVDNAKFNDPHKISQKDLRQKQKDLKNIERRIETLEVQIKQLEEKFKDPEFYSKDPANFTKETERLEKLKPELDTLIANWETLQIL